MLINRNGYIVLTDFGLAASLDGEPAGLRGKTGTRGYWAPEVVRKEPQAESADWWSLGVVLAYAATGRHPFRRRDWRRPSASAAPHLLEHEQQPTGPAAVRDDGTGCSSSADPAAAAAPAPAPSKPEARKGGAFKPSAALPEAPVAGDVEMGDVAPADTAANAALDAAARAADKKWTEMQLNDATLHMPIAFDDALLGADLVGLLMGLLRRHASSRLGAESGYARLRGHAHHCPPAPWAPESSTRSA